ncbi:hypothetical protein [Methylacidiphilum caldifontis]|uniref:Uncharacterized protein n=1 Tax=Methylacidiphilum caldifontis TaxID=2795386 RepID=A0A4Y8PGL2_9BACT|nr:hypothetical protein [Methylacidiphilum caldifontis]QSR89543.1 hypothetical protein IT6_04520 [Methylacidiphilum caldifontis]TFE71117.1 hypothetical protein A7Q10_05095 [Methylacidiphilum caldifontis]
MSLRQFHLVFITLAILLFLTFGAWAIYSYFSSQELLYIGLGVGSFLLGILAVIYGVWFVLKMKKLKIY